jgi:F-type H+-transporting ATPase subunit delta
VGRESLVGRFIRLVAERDRIDELPTIAEWFAKLEDRDAGRVRLEIRAPAELSQAEVAGVCQAFRELAGGEVVAQVRTDPGLLGGAVVELEGRVFDGSIKTALERLALRMAGSASAAGA